VSGEIVAAELVAAHPGGAAHILLLGVVAVIALVAFGVMRWRQRREAAASEQQSDSHGLPPGSGHSTEEKDNARSGPTTR